MSDCVSIHYHQPMRRDAAGDIESGTNAGTGRARPSTGFALLWLGLAMLGWGELAGAAPSVADPPVAASGAARNASLDDYRAHLLALAALTKQCAGARDAAHCDAARVGADDRVPFTADRTGRRLVRYGWLRVLLASASKPDELPKKQDSKKGPAVSEDAVRMPTTSELLQAAQTRLATDLAQAGAPAEAAAAHPAERDAMKQVLAGREFRGLGKPSAQGAMLEKVSNWLNRLFESAARYKAQSAWVGRVLIYGLIASLCVGLAWALIRMERRWRVRLVPESDGPAPGAASARDWQLWMDDARRAAQTGAWREAIHFVYWASISRLESRRLWPADRARTPREYLALVAADDPRREGLRQLTGSFERTWYGGRPAAEVDYRQAEQLASTLIAGASAGAGGAVRTQVSVEGGAA